MKCSDDRLEDQLLERFIRYAVIETTSDRHADRAPSTDGQWKLLRMLEREAADIGIRDVTLTENGYLIARIPANRPDLADSLVIGFMAHVDTSADVSTRGVAPQVHREYDGGDIVVGNGLVLSPADFPDLLRYRGGTIVTTDGSTLLGADDKAGIAEIMTAAECLLAGDGPPHGPIELIFTPDEETGRGMDAFPVDALRSRCCYTLDGDVLGSIEAECFNAYKVDVAFSGRSIHPGTARGKLVNAVSMAAAFVSMLPRNESPEATDGRYGFYLPLEIKGSAESASVTVYLRDFSMLEIDRRLEALRRIGAAVEAMFAGGSVALSPAVQYRNMKEYTDRDPRVVGLLEEAVRRAGLEPVHKAVRGGTDGARLSELGIPAPNIFTGGHNYHSRLEWAALPAMAAATRVIVQLAHLWSAQDAHS